MRLDAGQLLLAELDPVRSGRLLGAVHRLPPIPSGVLAERA
jgi:hypothetical protein